MSQSHFELSEQGRTSEDIRRLGGSLGLPHSLTGIRSLSRSRSLWPEKSPRQRSSLRFLSHARPPLPLDFFHSHDPKPEPARLPSFLAPVRNQPDASAREPRSRLHVQARLPQLPSPPSRLRTPRPNSSSPSRS
ncbi:hypothetical protein MA16_Dca014979 [Dendrobium catenatum]|uniref:Uncharacterized protein n=1 Tax=Dendrobium catenatum TaxID=906689 RepID=A0A2I0V9K3_9ASPA|nr:hypothetical protein MA16_Dca014979 [Dendrobium catenatum]